MRKEAVMVLGGGGFVESGTEQDGGVKETLNQLLEYTDPGESKPLRRKPPKLHLHERTRAERREKVQSSLREVLERVDAFKRAKAVNKVKGVNKRGSFSLSG